jgi:hypothetical protein
LKKIIKDKLNLDALFVAYDQTTSATFSVVIDVISQSLHSEVPEATVRYEHTKYAFEVENCVRRLLY